MSYSCVDLRQAYGDGSVDLSKEHEGGASALIPSTNVGYNVMVGIWSSNTKNLDHTSSSAEGSEFAKSQAGGGIGFNAQFGFVKKGSKLEGSTTNLNYLELIGDVMYFYDVKGGGTLYGGLGPYVAYGIGGNVKFGDTKEAAFGGTDGYKRFDAGLNLQAGYKFPIGLKVGVGYDLGLVNKSKFDDFTSKNRTLTFDVGYFFHIK